MRLTIPAGAFVLVTAHPKARHENSLRTVAMANQYGAASGKDAQLFPPWLVLIHGERDALAPLLASGAVRTEWPYHPAPERVTVEVGAFDWSGDSFRSAYAAGRFPRDWIHPAYAEQFGAWLETTAGAVITTEQGERIARETVTTEQRESIASASDVPPPSKPRRTRAAVKDAA